MDEVPLGVEVLLLPLVVGGVEWARKLERKEETSSVLDLTVGSRRMDEPRPMMLLVIDRQLRARHCLGAVRDCSVRWYIRGREDELHLGRGSLWVGWRSREKVVWERFFYSTRLYIGGGSGRGRESGCVVQWMKSGMGGFALPPHEVTLKSQFHSLPRGCCWLWRSRENRGAVGPL